MYFRFSRQTWVTFLQCHQQRLVLSISGGKKSHIVEIQIGKQIGNTKSKYKVEIQIGKVESLIINYATNYIVFK